MSCGSPVALGLLFTLSFSSFFSSSALKGGKKVKLGLFSNQSARHSKGELFSLHMHHTFSNSRPLLLQKESDSKQWHVYSSTPMTLTKWPDAVFTSKKKISSLDTDLQLIWSIKWLTCFKGNLSIHFETTRALGFKVHETFLETVRRLIVDSLLTHCHVLTR